MDEVPRERANSSEPCSGRPNPFDDTSDQTSRKRQRTSRGGSRSRSVDTLPPGMSAVSSQMPSTSPDREAANPEVEPPLPSTPTRAPSEELPAEPTSSRVTINLRTHRPLDTIPSSPPTPTTPSKMPHVNGEETRASIESESDALSPVLVETPSSSPSAIGTPSIELVIDDEDDLGYNSHDPHVAIIDDGDSGYSDVLTEFPYYSHGDPLTYSVNKMVRFFQYDAIDSEEGFVRIRDWIQKYLLVHADQPSFYHTFEQNRDFLMGLPDVFWALSWRSRFFGEFLRRSQDGREALTEMMVQMARLCGRFVAMDVRTLSYLAKKGDSNLEPDVGSRPYLTALAFLLRIEEGNHLGRNLNHHYSWNWAADIARMSHAFVSDGGSIANITKLVSSLLKWLARYPKLVDNLTEPSRIVSIVIKQAASRSETANVVPDITNETRVKIRQGLEYFTVMSNGLEQIIEKHLTFLSSDAAVTHMLSLQDIMQSVLKIDKGTLYQQQQQSSHSGLDKTQLPHIIPLEWKFTILHKLITSTQMQLRVVGVTTMCNDLLAIYNSYKDTENGNAVLMFFANFIIRNQIIEYLVGIGSHPEIINESNNILGFLLVTKTYTPGHTDMIWQTVINSQDPRVIEAILRMVIRCMNLAELGTLLHLCRKAGDIPTSSYTLAMRDYCHSLFKEIVKKTLDSSAGLASVVDAAPYQLCVRLIRDSSVARTESPTGFMEVQNFFTSRLHELLIHGPSPDVRRGILFECIDDIRKKTSTAAGSVCIINALQRSPGRSIQMASDLKLLTTEHGLVQLLVEELESNIQAATRQPLPMTAASTARLELLLSIILQEPDSISTDLGERLWNVLVGNGAKSSADRNNSWQIFNSAVMRSPPSQNSFLSACLREYLPGLPSSCFTKGSLDFANEAVRSWLNTAQLEVVDEEHKFDTPALEQLWRMILTAPPNTIDADAIKILVGVYVDSKLITSILRTTARSIHLTLVDRCLRQLRDAASRLKSFSDGASSGSDEGMVIVASEDQFQEQEKIFARSLAVLREFLRAYQAKPQFATPKSRSPIPAASTDQDGDTLEIKYQSFEGDKQNEIRTLTLGKRNTIASLFACLQKATGFKNYNVYCGGREVDIDETEVCKSLEDLKISGLVLVRSREDSEVHLSGKGTLEGEITKHFDDLWSYLGMHEKVAQEIYYFLIKFPIYSRMTNDFEADTPYEEIFPSAHPYKSLYAIHCLRDHVITKSKQGELEEHLLLRAIQLLVAAISDKRILDQCPDGLKDCLALHLLDCFIQFLKESPLPSSLANLLDDGLLERLVQILRGAMSSETSQNSVNLTWRSFEAILDASSHSSELWQSFGSQLRKGTLLRELLLEDHRPTIRKSVVKHVAQKCSSPHSPSQIAPMSFAVTFWPLVSALIPEAALRPEHCEETFALALPLFNKLAASSVSSDIINLNELVREWGEILLAHNCVEIVGYPESVDMVAHGLSSLLLSAAQRAKASRQTLTCGTIGTDLFRKHLFPQLSDEPREDESIVPRIPLLNPSTRQIVADTIFLLVKDDDQEYPNVVNAMAELVPYSPSSDTGPYSHDLTYGMERAKTIRSSTGYVGLRNLSNTCYLNSLFTQLFMNVPFRAFMLQATVAENSKSQKLLYETQRLFGHMQNSLGKFVDPTDLAGSIRTYEETPIDVAIQMDVDEFYNLLFDRWESQMLTPDMKQQFKSFYGGVLVQQVKSKECPHISERLEAFSAIQCDIKGKSNLQESLQAYVDGEVMEGDNKYKCSQCDRHVDAVKRACLKDIPDNLIFHLKRFDFNLRTLQRSKINDHFQFPKSIDMRPYKVEHLMESPDEIPEDHFELVGVLVHAGTAESGHYYSMIRERPTTNDKDSWVEFNDDNVTPWDPNVMESACFGGPEYRGPLDSSSMQYDKTWSAYMLFYQRSSTLTTQRQSLELSGLTSPIRLPVSAPLANYIAMENELLMRKYCLHDPSHATFVIKMLSNVKQLNGGHCSQLHQREKEALVAAANHLDQVFARCKDTPHFADFMIAIRQVCHSCPECSRDYLEWFFECPDALRQLLLRNPDMSIRGDIATSILFALSKVRREAAYAYGFSDDDESGDDLEGSDPQLIQKMVKALNKLFEVFQSNIRAWPEYFGLLVGIATVGKRESALLLDAGFLRKALEIISADALLPLGIQYQKMLSIISKRLASRPVAFDNVIELIATLMKACDFSAEAVQEGDDRLYYALQGDPIPLSVAERHLLMQHWTRNQAHILVEKLFMIGQNREATEQILKYLLDWPDSLDQYILLAIVTGIKQRTHTRSFLHAALFYCAHTTNAKSLFTILNHAGKAAAHDGEAGDFLTFFTDILGKEDGYFAISKDEIQRIILDQMHVWAPNLLTDPDVQGRRATELFLQDIILRHGPEIEIDDSEESQLRAASIIRTVRKLGLACLDYLQERFIRQRQTVVQATLEQIEEVITSIKEFLDPHDDDDETLHFFEKADTVIPALTKCVVEELEDDISDWDGSEADYDDSSEPMDRLNELSGPEDVQL